MVLHSKVFEHLQPTKEQLAIMDQLRKAAQIYADTLEEELPEGPDKTWCLRQLRDVAMWANVAVTRLPDGTPRE